VYHLQGAKYARLTTNFKKNDTQQAKMINNFKSAKQKLLQTNAVIWFNPLITGKWF
jgi:hypothetical protein